MRNKSNYKDMQQFFQVFFSNFLSRCLKQSRKSFTFKLQCKNQREETQHDQENDKFLSQRNICSFLKSFSLFMAEILVIDGATTDTSVV
jgi:hypothetical protein